MFNIFKVRTKNGIEEFFVCGLIGEDRFLLYDPINQKWLISPCNNYVLVVD